MFYANNLSFICKILVFSFSTAFYIKMYIFWLSLVIFKALLSKVLSGIFDQFIILSLVMSSNLIISVFRGVRSFLYVLSNLVFYQYILSSCLLSRIFVAHNFFVKVCNSVSSPLILLLLYLLS